MNTSQHLYERAAASNTQLSPDQENLLEPKHAILYAKNIVKRKLHGPRVNQKLRDSVYAEQYEQLPRPRKSAFEASLAMVTEGDCNVVSAPKKLEDDAIFPKSRILHGLIANLHDQFNCHPSMLNTKEDFDKLASNGSAMKQYILNYLQDTQCCGHMSKMIERCLGDDDCGRKLIMKLYKHAHNWV